MADSETKFLNGIRVSLQKFGGRMFRNNNGVAIFQKNGKESRVKYGLGTGTSDLIGWTPVYITDDMVGKTLAVFTAVEGKQGSGRLTKAQRRFLEAVRAAGGIGVVLTENSETIDFWHHVTNAMNGVWENL